MGRSAICHPNRAPGLLGITGYPRELPLLTGVIPEVYLSRTDRDWSHPRILQNFEKRTLTHRCFRMRITILLLALLTIAIIGCSDSGTDAGSGQGRLVIEMFDAPGPDSVDAIFLHVIEVSVHHSDNGWLVIAAPDTVINFLDLVNGVMVELADDSLGVGTYDQLRLLLADTNTVVIAGDTFDLTTPSAHSSGVKLHAAFTVEDDELVRLYVDFDASKAITMASDKYILNPSFKVFKEMVSGRVSGKVSDGTGVGIEGAVVDAVSDTDTTSTITNEDGDYLLVLPPGSYDISASASGYASADTTYSAVVVMAGMSEMMNVDFVLE